MLKTIGDTFKEATRIAAKPATFVFAALTGLFGWATLAASDLAADREREKKSQSKIVDRRLD